MFNNDVMIRAKGFGLKATKNETSKNCKTSTNFKAQSDLVCQNDFLYISNSAVWVAYKPL